MYSETYIRPDTLTFVGFVKVRIFEFIRVYNCTKHWGFTVLGHNSLSSVEYKRVLPYYLCKTAEYHIIYSFHFDRGPLY